MALPIGDWLPFVKKLQSVSTQPVAREERRMDNGNQSVFLENKPGRLAGVLSALARQRSTSLLLR